MKDVEFSVIGMKCPHCGSCQTGANIRIFKGKLCRVDNSGFCYACGKEWYDGTTSEYPLKPIKEGGAE